MRQLSLGADLRFSFRMLRRNPAFTVAAMLTLALGIGAATAIFNVADEALLSPLPLSEPQQLVAVYNLNKKTSHPAGGAMTRTSCPLTGTGP